MKPEKGRPIKDNDWEVGEGEDFEIVMEDGRVGIVIGVGIDKDAWVVLIDDELYWGKRKHIFFGKIPNEQDRDRD